MAKHSWPCLNQEAWNGSKPYLRETKSNSKRKGCWTQEIINLSSSEKDEPLLRQQSCKAYERKENRENPTRNYRWRSWRFDPRAWEIKRIPLEEKGYFLEETRGWEEQVAITRETALDQQIELVGENQVVANIANS